MLVVESVIVNMILKFNYELWGEGIAKLVSQSALVPPHLGGDRRVARNVV